MVDLPSQSKVAAWLAGGMALLFCLNWLAVKWTGFPFAYCWGGALVGPVYREWIQPAFTLVTIIFIVTLFMGRFALAFKAAMVMVIAGVIPAWGETLYRLGGVCHAG